MTFPLEDALWAVGGIQGSCEWQIDILRQVLTSQSGTPDQRNALIRIINQNKPKNYLGTKLERNLQLNASECAPARNKYA